MPSQLFSITKEDKSVITGDQLEARVIESFQKEDVLANLGLLYEAPSKIGQVVRIPAPLRVIPQEYQFSVDDSGISPDELQASTLKVEINKFAYGSFTTESQDKGL